MYIWIMYSTEISALKGFHQLVYQLAALGYRPADPALPLQIPLQHYQFLKLVINKNYNFHSIMYFHEFVIESFISCQIQAP